MKTYLVHTEDCQSPEACTYRILAPHPWRNVSPPLLSECPENLSGLKPALERRNSSLAVKLLYITHFKMFPGRLVKAGQLEDAFDWEKRRSRWKMGSRALHLFLTKGMTFEKSYKISRLTK